MTEVCIVEYVHTYCSIFIYTYVCTYIHECMTVEIIYGGDTEGLLCLLYSSPFSFHRKTRPVIP